MVEAEQFIQAPYHVYYLPTGEIIIRKRGSVVKIHPKLNTFEILEDTQEFLHKIQAQCNSQESYGVFGHMNLPSGPYLIMIDRAKIIGTFLKCQIFRVESLKFVSINNASCQKFDSNDQPFIDMIQNLQRHKAFYFSYTLDLTKRIQLLLEECINRRGALDDLINMFPTSINYIPKYAFNHNMLREFKDKQYSPFRVPCIYGFVSLAKINQKLDFVFITRKDVRRPGRRFLVRGLDKEGNAANFCETEHIFVHYKQNNTSSVTSHVQIRGSIPLIWTMKPNMQWSPPVVVSSNFDESFQAAKNHVKEVNDEYQRQYMINLIDKKGSQQKIGNKFTEMLSQLKENNVDYTWFDFHGECKKMKWENLSKLIQIVESELTKHGYFTANLNCNLDQRQAINSQTCKIETVQKGVMRTNCMDCLDRTNVVQSVISRNIAHQQLKRLGFEDQNSILKSAFQVFEVDNLEAVFRNIWSDNADVVSILYTGTPALKTDFTRTGKRTYKGAINDGLNSITRYYINNFCDGYNHDCLDISQQKLTPSLSMTRRQWLSPLKIQFFGILGCLYLTHVLLESYMPQPEIKESQEYKVFTFHSLVYACVIIGGIVRIFANGKNFVDEASRLV